MDSRPENRATAGGIPMNIAKGWSRIERVLLVVAVAGSVIAVGLSLYNLNAFFLYLLIPAWLPYLSARIIGWIVQATLDEDNHI